jgi:hypothetical protein
MPVLTGRIVVNVPSTPAVPLPVRCTYPEQHRAGGSTSRRPEDEKVSRLLTVRRPHGEKYHFCLKD